MNVRNLFMKDRKVKYLLPHEFSKHSLINGNIATKSVIHIKLKENTKKVKNPIVKKKLIHLNKIKIERNLEKKKLIDKSVGSDSPVFELSERMPKIVKNLMNFDRVKIISPIIHSAQSRSESQKSFIQKNISITSPFFSKKNDFKVLLVGQNVFSKLKFK